MKKTQPLRKAFALLVTLSSLPFAVEEVRAATMSASATAPVARGLDIANYGAVTGNDKWFAGTEPGTSAAKGQTFTTGATPVLLKAITYQVTASQQAAPTKGYTIRVGTVSGTTFTQIHSETATQTFQWNGGHYMTWTLAIPLSLSPNTLYGIDIAMTSSTSAWQTGIPYINVTANGYAGGQRYISGANGAGNSTLTFTSTSDRTFHLDLQHPLNPSPEIGANVPAGDVTLSWSNLTPNIGADVWVDVWFGTSAGAMTKVASAGQNLSSFQVNLPGAATYYWRIDSYLDGAPTGAPVQSTVFSFMVTDSDSDGFPDTYELANTTPPSATALNVGDDLDTDGLTNWQEFQLGTSPINADTDGDTLNDSAELAGVGARPATDPLKADTDGDGLNDAAENNSGTWVGATSTGTNPANADTDRDGLRDGVETNSGSYGSTTNTGTNPLITDTDADGAGDWYEVTASFTNPLNATSKPNVPYPLPAPDSNTGATNKPVKVYILSGQSNMVGFGRVSGTGTGTLNTITKTENKFPHLVTSGGAWTSRSDVRYRGVISAIYPTANDEDLLKPGFGANSDSFGPEFGFGHVMGWYHDEPVLLIKTSIGNRSLLWDIAPPDSTRFDYNGKTYAGYGDSPNTWNIGSGPTPFVWYAGKQFDDFFLGEADMRPGLAWASGIAYPNGCQLRHNGVVYSSKSAHTSAATSQPGVGATWSTFWSVYSVTNVTDVLDNFATQYPQWASRGFEIAGFAWWQGYNDMSQPAAGRYEARLTSLINHLRTYYGTRYPGKIKPNAPFVLGTIAFGGWGLSGDGLAVANAQLAVGNPAIHPEFAGNVKTMEARSYWRSTGPDTSQGHHYNHNAETYYLLGDALGRGMVEMLTTADTTAPTLGSIADDKTGGPVTANTPVNFAVTFSEDMDAATVSATDFGNAGTAAISIGAVTETAPGVFAVAVTPTAAGTLRLRINAGAGLKDVAGISLVTTPALLDDTTITVNPASSYSTWAATNAPGGTAADDFDGDGVSNGVEYVLGGTAPSNDQGKLPGVSISGGNVIFSFNRAQASIDGTTAATIETGTEVGTWTASYPVPDGAASSNPGVSVVKNTSPGYDTVSLSVPQAAKAFVRLKVVTLTP